MADTAQRGLTRADLDDFPDDGHRRELVDGVLCVSPLARRRHQHVVMRIARRLDEWCDEHGGIVYPGVNVDLAADTHLEPDVVWSEDDDLTGPGFDVVPELVVEVASPSTRRFDAGVKLQRYAAAGAREVWLVDLDRDEVHRHRVIDGTPADAEVLTRGGGFTSTAPPGLELDVDAMLGIRPT